jgi:hypothetical protein
MIAITLALFVVIVVCLCIGSIGYSAYNKVRGK